MLRIWWVKRQFQVLHLRVTKYQTLKTFVMESRWLHLSGSLYTPSLHVDTEKLEINQYYKTFKILVSFSKKKRKIQRLQVNQIMVCTHWRQIILIDMWKWDCILWNSMPHGKWKNIIFMVLTWCSRIFLLIFMLAHCIPMLKVKGSSPKLD